MDRRDFMKGAGAIAAVAALPIPVAAAGDVMTPEQVATAKELVVKMWALDHEAAQFAQLYCGITPEMLGVPDGRR